jgi:hypothetical protein
MRNMRERNSDNDYVQGRNTIILHKISHLNLLQMNKLLSIIIVSLMIIVLALGYFMFPTNSLIHDYDAKQIQTNINKVDLNPVLSAEINTLKAQVVGLISGSIESKLRTLEVSIRSGKISSSDLGTIQDLKNDVKVLKTYSATGAGRLIATNQTLTTQNGAITSKKLVEEVTQLKSLIYISIASCGLMLAAIGGIWLQNRLRLGYDGSSRRQYEKKLLNK